MCLLDDHLRAEVSYCSLGEVQFGTCCVQKLPSLKHPNKTNMSREKSRFSDKPFLVGQKLFVFLKELC